MEGGGRRVVGGGRRVVGGGRRVEGGRVAGGGRREGQRRRGRRGGRGGGEEDCIKFPIVYSQYCKLQFTKVTIAANMNLVCKTLNCMLTQSLYTFYLKFIRVLIV